MVELGGRLEGGQGGCERRIEIFVKIKKMGDRGRVRGYRLDVDKGFPVNSYSSQFVLILVNSYSKFWPIRTHLVNSYSCLVSSYSFWSIRTHFGQFVLKLK